MSLDDWLKRELNPEQLAAAGLGEESTLRIIAGPGTGKTKTLVWRYLALTLGQDLPADRVLALTFTERAASEMQERVRSIYQSQGLRLDNHWISTFHAFCYRVVTGDNPALPVLNELGQLKLRQALQQEMLTIPDLGEQYPFLDFAEAERLFEDAFWVIERLRDAYRPAEEIAALVGVVSAEAELSFRRDLLAFTAALYQRQRARLAEISRLDYPEMVYQAYHRLRDDQLLVGNYRQLFRHILVDEFQDTSRSQLELLKLLSPGLARVTVVGDRKQSIYGWRNARPENFNDAALELGEAKLLTYNYRSYQEILEVAAQVLRPLESQKLFSPDELILSARRGGNSDGAVTVACPNDGLSREEGQKAEARYIASEIKRRKEADPEQTIALLLRSVKSQSRLYEEALRAEKLDYITAGAGGFYDRGEVRDLIGLLRLLQDPTDGQAFYRIARSPLFGLDHYLLYELGQSVRQCKLLSLELAIPLHSDPPPALLALQAFIQDCRPEIKKRKAGALVEWILSGPVYQAYLQSRPPGEKARVEANLKKLVRLVREFELSEPQANLPEVIEYFKLWLENDLLEQEEAISDQPAGPGVVQIMTVHQAKGLEFDTVFVAGLKPSQFRLSGRLFSYEPDYSDLFENGFALLSFHSGENREYGSDRDKYQAIQRERWQAEERFICYVALTRAKSKLYISTSISEKLAAEMKGRAETFFFRELLDWARVSHSARITKI